MCLQRAVSTEKNTLREKEQLTESWKAVRVCFIRAEASTMQRATSERKDDHGVNARVRRNQSIGKGGERWERIKVGGSNTCFKDQRR